jgi:glutamate decarboxylase
VIAQYFMFVSLGFEGYRKVQQHSQNVALYLSSEIDKIGPYECLTDGSELPVFAFKVKDDVKNFDVYHVSARLRERGWQVPAYTFPEHLEDLSVLRIVVRAGMSIDQADMLLGDLRSATENLEALEAPLPARNPLEVQSFAH